MAEWRDKDAHRGGSAREQAGKISPRWVRLDAVPEVDEPVDDPRIAMEALGILSTIIKTSSGADSLADMLARVLEAICRRYPGLAGALASFDGTDIVVDLTSPTEPVGVDWEQLFSGMPAWAAEQTDSFRPILLESNERYALALLLAAEGGVQRAIAFADPGDVVDIPRGVLVTIALECDYVFDREMMMHRLREREAQFRAIFDASPIPQALMVGDDVAFAVVNDALCRLLGYSRDQLLGLSARAVTHPDDVEVIETARWKAAEESGGQGRVERRMIAANADIIYTVTTLTWIDLPGRQRMLLQQIADITAQRLAERDALEQAETDSLTGLGNRLRLVRVIDQLEKSGEEFGVVFLDVDSFKSINDARGHEVGDEILTEVATRLAAAAGPHDLVVRFGGDEFVVLCRAAGSAGPGAAPIGERDITGKFSPLSQAVRAAADLAQVVLSEPIDTSSGSAHITVSIGICDDTIPVAHAIDRLLYADTAAYRAKRLGEDRKVVYDSGLHRQTTEFRRVEALLRTALEEERFVVHYQPIVDVADGRPVGMEALVRLLDENGHLVPPGQFIHVAERSGLIVPMGAWVLGTACRTAADLRRALALPIHISVNVAARQASRPDLVRIVDRALEVSGLPPEVLTLELTESALLEADGSTLARLHDMSSRGIEIALDDFGTGYSSLTYLRQLPVTRIKVDQSFVGAMTTDRGSAAIVKAVITLASDLGLTWVAEGVETAEQWARLQDLGTGLAQGYYFARPQPKQTLQRIMAGRLDAPAAPGAPP